MLQAKTIFLVLLWWSANGLTSIYSKTEMSGAQNTRSFSKLKWLDLTAVQFFFGVLGSAFWITFIERRALNIQKICDWNSFVVILANLVGHLSVNVSYTFVSSTSTQAVKSSEPIFMFLFLACLRSQHSRREKMNALVFFSIVLMVFGTFLFVIWDVTFHIWGIVAAVASNIAFPLRNIALKNMNLQYESPFEKYFILSFFGTLLLVPFLVVKLIFQGTSLADLSQAGMTSGSFHCVYNLASISVLQNVSPLSHAILNFSKRILVIILNIKYFNLIMTWHMFLGLLFIFLGLAIYLSLQNTKSTSLQSFYLWRGKIPRKCFFLVGFLVLLSTLLVVPRMPNLVNQPVSNGNLTTAWVFSQPMTDTFVEHIVTAQAQTGASVYVYCGTMKCLETVEKLKKPMITARFLVVSHVLGQTPLKEWGERHVLYKILTGLRYNWYLTQALCLAHLWQYGGSFYHVSYGKIMRITNVEQPQNEQQVNWPCLSFEDVKKGDAFFKNIPPRDQRVRQKMEDFLRSMNSWNSEKLPKIFQDNVWNAFLRRCPNGTRYCYSRNPKNLRGLYKQNGIPFEDDYHFGTLSLNNNVFAGKNRGNIGDEIQSIAGIQFLPFLDFYLDRDVQISPATRGKHTVFFNAWWGRGRGSWPPSENIEPVMISVHTTGAFQKRINSSTKAANFLKANAPIGARDIITKRFLDTLGVQSFFSGCMTLFIQAPQKTTPVNRDDTIYIVDLSKNNLNLLPKWIRQKAKFVKHTFEYGESPLSLTTERYLNACKLLEKYSRAKLVITRRIHAALPCVAMGTPVIFFNAAKMPGGGGDSAAPTARVAGLVELFHVIDFYKLTTEQAAEKLRNFNWTNPPRNPSLAIRMRMVSSMWFIIRRNQAIYESARRFGMLPLTPEWLTKVESSLVFHVIHDDTNQDVASSGGLSWCHWRCIESILRHHPTSRLFVYSNILEQSVFDPLTEVGYHITIKNYQVSDLAEETPLKPFLIQFRKTSSDEKILYQHGVLRLLLLYTFGGVYLSEDTIVLKPVDTSKSNVISLDPESKVNPWMLNIERNHEFLRDVLEMFPIMYAANMEPDEGKALLTKIWISWQRDEKRNNSINIAKKNNFYTLIDTSEALYKSHSQFLKDEVYVIRIPDVHKYDKYLERKDNETPRFKQGIVLKEIYNEHCLFCSNQY